MLGFVDLILTWLVIVAIVSGIFAITGNKKASVVFFVFVALLILVYCWRNDINLLEELEKFLRKLFGHNVRWLI